MRTVAALHVAAVCLAGGLAVPVSAQLAMADLQRVEEAAVDADVDGTISRRVCLNASAYVLAVEGVQLNGTFYGEGMLVWEDDPAKWISLQVDPDGDGDNWTTFNVEGPGCFTVRATMARVRVYLLRVAVDWGGLNRPERLP